ncbi:MAG TPA: glycerophosphodiester phosphodiesterase family protein [Longimicrobiales bacterium]|nr:glycerophosphodiester phosphodiesterase family protein [Longimicrobiales bacterium]
MPEPSSTGVGTVEIIAHRGYSAVAPENTLAAIAVAIAAGADAVEFDVHVTRDGVPVLFHDGTLDRTTDGCGPLSARSYEELLELDAGSWFGAAFAGEPVPSLEDVLARLAGRPGRVYPEVKGYRRARDLHHMVDLARQRGVEDRTVFISMDWQALEHMREHDAGVRIGYIVEEPGRADEALARATGDPRALLDFKAAILLADPALARRAQEVGVDLAVWTVDDPRQAVALLALGVRRITSNRVAELLAWKAKL